MISLIFHPYQRKIQIIEILQLIILESKVTLSMNCLISWQSIISKMFY